MHTGTLIDDLIAAVERAEKDGRAQAAQEERWYSVAPYEVTQIEANLVGVA
jgi:hypothetical protein